MPAAPSPPELNTETERGTHRAEVWTHASDADSKALRLKTKVTVALEEDGVALAGPTSPHRIFRYREISRVRLTYALGRNHPPLRLHFWIRSNPVPLSVTAADSEGAFVDFTKALFESLGARNPRARFTTGLSIGRFLVALYIIFITTITVAAKTIDAFSAGSVLGIVLLAATFFGSWYFWTVIRLWRPRSATRLSDLDRILRGREGWERPEPAS